MNTRTRNGLVIGSLLYVLSLVFYLFQVHLSESTEEQVTAKTTSGPRENQTGEEVLPLCYDTPASRLQALTGEWVENAISLQDVSYYNLSCPLEWDRYSCVHQEKLQRAELAATTRFQPQDCRMASDRYTSEQLSNLLIGRNVFFYGDSLLRQILLSLGCLWHSRSVDYVDALQWRPCPKQTAELAKCYDSKVKNCVPCGRNSDSLPRTELHLGNVSHHSVFRQSWNKTLAEKLTNKDVLVVEAGVHESPEIAASKLAEFLWGMLRKRSHVLSEMPKIVYVVTWPSTFPGVPNGLYDLSQLMRRKSSGQSMACVATTNDYYDVETKVLKDKQQGDIQLMDSVSGIVWLEGTGSQGMNKVGEGRWAVGDCQHFCLPGPPDDFARALETMLFQVMRNS